MLAELAFKSFNLLTVWPKIRSRFPSGPNDQHVSTAAAILIALSSVVSTRIVNLAALLIIPATFQGKRRSPPRFHGEGFIVGMERLLLITA